MARGSRERYGAWSRLDDCWQPGPGSGAELFVVEGQSAAAVARVRDAEFQAAGGVDAVMQMVDALERAELHWCIIGDIARLVEAHPYLEAALPEDVTGALAGGVPGR